MSLSDLNEVSNFSWRCQLSYETLLLWSVPKLECPETIIYHRDTLTPPPRILNWPKSPHRLGLKNRFLRTEVNSRALVTTVFLNFFLNSMSNEWNFHNIKFVTIHTVLGVAAVLDCSLMGWNPSWLRILTYSRSFILKHFCTLFGTHLLVEKGKYMKQYKRQKPPVTQLLYWSEQYIEYSP